MTEPASKFPAGELVRNVRQFTIVDLKGPLVPNTPRNTRKGSRAVHDKFQIPSLNQVRMLLDQNIMGSFIHSPSFAGVARDLMKVKSAQDEISAEEEEKVCILAHPSSLNYSNCSPAVIYASYSTESSFCEEQGGILHTNEPIPTVG